MIAGSGATRSRSCCPRTCRSSGASCSRCSGPRSSSSPGDEGSNGAVRRAQVAGRRAPRLGVPVPVRQRGQPPGPLRGRPVRRSGATAPRSPTSSPASARSGTLMGVGHLPQGAEPRRSRSGRSSRPSGEMVEGLRNLDEGYIPPVFEKWGGYELLDGKSIVRPRESLEWTRRLAEVGVFAGHLVRARPSPAPSSGASRSSAGTIVFVVVRRRLEVPLHRRLDRRPRRGGGERREDHLLLIALQRPIPPVHREPTGG